jgi:tripartite-type tricarboxylate transporter receptor subunit TctC
MRILKLTFSLCGLFFCVATMAQPYPNRAITLIVPFPPGGSTDQMARAIAPKMKDVLNQSIIIDNKPGATGTVGAGFVKRASPDGYTLLVTSLGPLVIVPHYCRAAITKCFGSTRKFSL